MKRLLLLTLTFSSLTSLFASKDTIPEVLAGPDALVYGCVSAISGSFIDSTVDADLPAPLPLAIRRSYSSCDWMLDWRDNHKFTAKKPYLTSDLYSDHAYWTYNHAGRMIFHQDSKTAMFNDENGGSILHLGENKEGDCRCIQDYCIGWTNTSSGQLTAKTNVHTSRLYGFRSETATYTNGSGIKRVFSCQLKAAYLNPKFKNVPLIRKFREDERHFANGMSIEYEFKEGSFDLLAIHGKDREGKRFLTIKTGENKEFILPDSRKSTCKRVPNGLNKNVLLSEAKPVGGVPVSYKYSVLSYELMRKPYMVGKIYPEGRYLLIDYEPNEYPSRGRVSRLYEPRKGKRRGVYYFEYYRNYTNVLDIYGNHTVYKYGERKRLDSIVYQKKGENGRQVTEYKKCFRWKPGRNEGLLLAQFALDRANKPLYCRNFEYDRFGNVLVEKTWGNFRGNETSFTVNSDGKVKEGATDCYVKTYEYGGGGQKLNLKLKETYPGEREVRFTYVDGTDLMESKLTYLRGRIVAREFFEYDNFALCISHIQDDGSSSDKNDLSNIHKRLITRAESYQSGHAIGLLKEKRTFYLDQESGVEVPLYREVLGYDRSRRINSRAVYDADLDLCYETSFEYDENDNCVKEIDKNGNTILRKFDKNKNCVYQRGPNPDVEVEITYDLMNLPLERKEIHPEGTFIHCFEYDLKNRLVKEIDFQGNVKEYGYDAFDRKISETHVMKLDPQGHPLKKRPTSTWSYDAFSRVTSEKDYLGFETRYKRNFNGDILFVKHPDGTSETNEYSMEGLLLKKTYQNQSFRVYTYDDLNRLVKEELFDLSHKKLEEYSYTYEGSQLVKTLDPLGNCIEFKYDGAGRKIETLITDSVTGKTLRTQFFYDSLCRQNRVRKWSDESHYTEQIIHWDINNYTLLELDQDSEGNVTKHISYEYDSLRQKTLQRTHNGQEIATTYYEYNSLGDLIQTTDPEGRQWRQEIDYVHTNEFGEQVKRVITYKPNGDYVVDEYNTIDKIYRKQLFSLSNELIQDQIFGYDPCGKVVYRKELTLSGGVAVGPEVITEVEYGPNEKVIRRVDAKGSPLEKETLWTYDEHGRLHSTKKPSGILITRSYDALNRMTELQSSDGSIHYSYQYDAGHRSIQTTDLITGEVTHRVHSGVGDLLEETLSNGLTVSYTYNELSQCTSFTLPDHSSVLYEYQGLNMKRASRLSPTGAHRYTHTFEQYNDRGQCTSMDLIHKSGRVSFEYDLMGRARTTQGSYYKEHIPNEGIDALSRVISRTTRDSQGEMHHHYTYDPMSQITSEKGFTEHSYQHDSRNNRVQCDDDSYSVDELSQLTQVGSYKLSYDDDGNLTLRETSEGTFRYSYDAWDRLIQVSLPDGRKAIYTYDSFNRRTKKTLTGEVDQLYLYEGQFEVGSLTPSGEFKEFRMIGSKANSETGQTLAIEINNSVYTPLHDLSGSITELVESGWVMTSSIESYRFDAFGVEVSGRDTFLNPWRYRGKRHDEETGFINFGRRYYIPELGRWVTKDPKGEIDGSNLYAYVRNNPITGVDHWGLFTFKSEGFAGKDNPNSLWNRTCANIGRGVTSTFARPSVIASISFWCDHVDSIHGGDLSDNYTFKIYSHNTSTIYEKVIDPQSSTSYIPLNLNELINDPVIDSIKETFIGVYTPDTPGVRPDKTEILVTGIDHTAREAIESCKRTANTGNVNVMLVCMPYSGNMLSEFKKGIYGAQDPNYNPDVAKLLSFAIKQCQATNPEGSVRVFCHSNGHSIMQATEKFGNEGINFKELSVYGFGGTGALQNKDYKENKNYISKYDSIVHSVCKDNIEIQRNNGSLVMLEPEPGCNSVIDHGLLEATYVKQFDKLIGPSQ